MRTIQNVSIRILLSLSAAVLGGCATASSSRVVEDFDFDWKFGRGDLAGALSPDYDDSEWRVVQAPHDWSIEGPFSPDNASCTGYLPGGVGWYRKTFTVDESLRGRRIAIDFDGVYNNSDVWINGTHLGHRPFGYIGFRYDLTPHVKFGQENVIAVRADHSKVADSRWYTGSGIYRHVQLVITDPVHIDQWGTFVTTPVIEEDRAEVTIQTDVRNDSDANADIVLVSEIYGPDGKRVGRAETPGAVAAGKGVQLVQTVAMASPVLWGIENPALYTLESQVMSGGKVIDETRTRFGIRQFNFDPDTGFTLNGKSMKLKGMCLHHDAGCLGAAVPKATWRRALEAMKEIGCNAIRTAHNPPSTELLDLCDEMGFVVMDEAFDEFTPPKKKWVKGRNEGEPDLYGYGEVFEAWSRRDIQDMVQRDRNHPSIILWSIGNEIDYPNDPFSHPVLGDGYQSNRPPAENLVKYGKPLVAAIKELDTTRPVTAAISHASVSNAVGFADIFDVVGYNYQEQHYEAHHAEYPNRVLYGSENGKSLEAWLAVENNDYISGQFIWTGIDYLGEAGIWPRRSWTGGVYDLCLDKKPVGWQRQSWWAEEPMIYIAGRPAREEGRRRWRGEPVPHWNWEAGSTVEVVCYTNCDEAELLLNGRSLGVQRMESSPQRELRWRVPFEAGELKSVGRRGGKTLCEFAVQTAGEPAAVALTCDRTRLAADGKDVCHVAFTVVDEKGVPAPNADDVVTFEVEGPAELIGLGNGDPDSIESMVDSTHRAWNGRGLAVIRSQRRGGTVTVRASGEGLAADEVTLRVR